MNLTVGGLVIGSLYRDNGSRRDCRQSRLRADAELTPRSFRKRVTGPRICCHFVCCLTVRSPRLPHN
jgi:hypothetical protein